MDFLETVRAEFEAWVGVVENTLCLAGHGRDTCSRPVGHDGDHAELKPSGKIVSWPADKSQKTD